VAATAAGMTWNLAAKLLEDQEAIADEFNERVAEITQQDHIDAWDYWNQGEL
jgi:predicted transglutaminase-like cysteine proteinase